MAKHPAPQGQFESPFAMTILPQRGTAKASRRGTRKTPLAGYGTPPEEPIGVAPPTTAQGDAPPVGPGGASRRGLQLGALSDRGIVLVGLLVVVLGVAGYLYVPKLLSKSGSSAPASTSAPVRLGLPTAVGQYQSLADAQVVQAAVSGERALDPALARATLAFYADNTGKPHVMVLVAPLPASVSATTAAQQRALIQRVNKAEPPALPLTAVPGTGFDGTLMCATGTGAAAAACLGVDSKYVLIVAGVGADVRNMTLVKAGVDAAIKAGAKP
jgi:hypothetical protein